MGNAIPETSHVLANFVPQTTFQSVDYLIVSTNTTAFLIGQIASVVRNITNSRFDWVIGVCYSGNSLRAKSDYLRNKNCTSVNCSYFAIKRVLRCYLYRCWSELKPYSKKKCLPKLK